MASLFHIHRANPYSSLRRRCPGASYVVLGTHTHTHTHRSIAISSLRVNSTRGLRTTRCPSNRGSYLEAASLSDVYLNLGMLRTIYPYTHLCLRTVVPYERTARRRGGGVDFPRVAWYVYEFPLTLYRVPDALLVLFSSSPLPSPPIYVRPVGNPPWRRSPVENRGGSFSRPLFQHYGLAIQTASLSSNGDPRWQHGLTDA